MPKESKPEQESVAQPPTRNIVRTRADNFATYYTNNSEVGMTTYDLSIKFALIEGADNENLYLKDQTLVTMSLNHAKALAMILSSYVTQYENENGKLFVPFATIPPAEVATTKIATALYDDKEKK